MKTPGTICVSTGITGSACMLMAAAAAAAWQRMPDTSAYIRNLGLISVLFFASICDLRFYRIPNRCICAGLLLWTVTQLPECIQEGAGTVFWRITAGFLTGSGILLVCLLIRAFVSRVTKRTSLGGGDIKLLLLGGVAAGPDKAPMMVFLACIFGLITVIHFTRRGQRESPLGPAISAAIILVLLCVS